MIKQLDWNDYMIDMLPQAVLNKSPSYFEKEFGFHFINGIDDLDYYTAAIFALDDTRLFSLKRYRGNELDTTNIYLPIEINDVDHITAIISKIVKELKLDEDKVLWQRKNNPNA